MYSGFTGLELWNGFSEFKPRIHSKLHAIYYAYFPRRIARGPLPEALRRWDELAFCREKGGRSWWFRCPFAQDAASDLYDGQYSRMNSISAPSIPTSMCLTHLVWMLHPIPA